MSNELRETLERSFSTADIVIRPDHPLLLRNPDALIVVNSRLCAVFVPHALETNNSAHLASRLMAARLALPRELKTLLLLPRDQAPPRGLIDDFGLTTTFSDRSLRRFVADNDDYGQSRAMDPSVQAKALRAFDTALSVTELAFRTSRIEQRRDLPSEAEELRAKDTRRIESGEFHYSPRNRRRISGGTSASVLRGRTKSTLVKQLIQTSSGHLLESFQLDRGVPYPRNISVHPAIAASAERLVGVRNRIAFATAFAGVAIIPSEDRTVVEASLSKISMALEQQQEFPFQ